MINVGLIVNPVAGIGGRVALKGSDGQALQQTAAGRGGEPRAHRRVARTLAKLKHQGDIRWYTWGGAMGEHVLRECGLRGRVLGQPQTPTSAQDTVAAAVAMVDAKVDLLLFAGGDGSARDLLGAVAQRVAVLGIPAGVKMHSGVFATTPETAAQVLERLAAGGLVRGVLRDVRDWDPERSADGEIRPKLFGELLVAELGGFVQHTKEAGRESEALAVTEISAQICEMIEASAAPWVLGPGGTLAAIKQSLGMEPTLLGVDVFREGQQICQDAQAGWLERLGDDARLVISFTRGQGFLLGRGNQQLSPLFLGRLGEGAMTVVGTRSKLLTLEGRPLLVDTDDPQLDRTLTGLIEVIAGYDDRLLYRVATHA